VAGYRKGAIYRVRNNDCDPSRAKTVIVRKKDISDSDST
jgi:hypothetical protein